MTVLPHEQNAVISPCEKYRYALTRQVGPGNRTATFIMLNPSTADATLDDPTIRRCIGFARQWECGRLLVLNLFAVRATDPEDMRAADDPVGPENKDWVDRKLQDLGKYGSAFDLGPVVCGWGVHGEYMDQDLTMLGWLDALGLEPMALGLTKQGHPRHPLYVPYTAELVSYSGRRS